MVSLKQNGNWREKHSNIKTNVLHTFPVYFFVPWVLEVRSLTLCVLHTFPVHFLVLRGGSPVSSLRVKPRPNDSNMWTQHIATLGAICCARLAALLRRVATCCLLLAQIWSSWAKNTRHRLAGGVEMRSLTGASSTPSGCIYLCVFPWVPYLVSVPLRCVPMFPISETDKYSYNKILFFINLQATSKLKLFWFLFLVQQIRSTKQARATLTNKKDKKACVVCVWLVFKNVFN